MKAAVVSLLLSAILPLYVEGATELEVHRLSGFTLNDKSYGFPDALYYGRIANVRSLYRDLASQSTEMTDAALEDALAKRMHKNGYTLMFRLQDVLQNRLDFASFRTLLKSSGSTAMLLIPPPSNILPGSPQGCTESPMLDSISGENLPVCKYDTPLFHQSTMSAFHEFLLNCDPKSLLAVVEEGEDALTVMREYASGVAPLGAVNRYRITSSTYKSVSNYKSLNIFGTLRSAHNEGVGDNAATDSSGNSSKEHDNEGAPVKPKIVLCSHFDTFSLLQSYRAAASNNAGLIALLELAHLLVGLDHHSYEVVVLLTSGSILNFQGAATFANSYPNITNVELVLCLDDLTGPELYVHTSSKSTAFSHFFQEHLSRSVSDTIKRGVNTKAKLLSFQHEQFSRQKVHSITLTSVKDSVALPLRQRSFEYSCDASVLANHVIAIAQALASALHCGPLAVDASEVQSRITSWEAKLGNPRCGLTHDLHKDKAVASIVDHLRPLLETISTQHVTSKVVDFGFNANKPMRVAFYRNRTTVYHVCVLLASVVYIFVMWSIIRASPKVAFTDIMETIYGASPSKQQDSPDAKPIGRSQSKHKIV
ncbi:hypothetical protein, conserved [Babesia bigemina]|uniref:BOS complex subunit NCLN n=1 Tax=Babesia bigemina TaxID=5866 RepID=A0A061DDQ7_BABBI|nr:hypothetical protein, conserved [Babesia bigemina]CDR97614.1 hypothetical protein, conserved [Babesia bigemina]|eukprot:XP_012769800.1 hypothetical protein, conserved [Babesia bigemina]